MDLLGEESNLLSLHKTHICTASLRCWIRFNYTTLLHSSLPLLLRPYSGELMIFRDKRRSKRRFMVMEIVLEAGGAVVAFWVQFSKTHSVLWGPSTTFRQSHLSFIMILQKHGADTSRIISRTQTNCHAYTQRSGELLVKCFVLYLYCLIFFQFTLEGCWK